MEIIGGVLAEKAVEGAFSECGETLTILLVLAILGWAIDKVHTFYLYVKHKVFKVPEPKKTLVDKIWNFFGF